MSTPSVPGISATPATGQYPSLTGLQLPKQLTDAVTQAYQLTYSLRDSQGQLQQVVARMVQYGTQSVRQQTNPQAVPDGALFFETDTKKSYQARLASQQTTRLWYELGSAAPAGGGATVVGYDINDATPGSAVGPLLVSPGAGSVTNCVVVVKLSDATVNLVFDLKQNGASVFSAGPTIPAGTASFSVHDGVGTLTSSPLPIAEDDVFSIDITSGSSNWAFTVELRE